jgi:DNA-binding protein H-NS
MSDFSLSELMARKAALDQEKSELERRIVEAQREERSAAIAKVRALMAEYGLTLADIGARAAAAPGRAAKKTGGARGGGKVAAKYLNKATGDKWSGRGLQPNWLKAELAAGRKLEDFAITS